MSQQPENPPKPETEATAKSGSKITLVLKATGSAPIMARKKWSVEPEKTISWVTAFVHNYLKLDKAEHLFLYVNQTFAPSPDQTLKNLYDSYGTSGTLTMNYCNSQAWG